MKKVLTLIAVLFCVGASAQTIVYDTTVVRSPLAVAVRGAGITRDTLTIPAATTAVNGYMTAASMSDIANLQTGLTTANNNISTLQATVNTIGGYVVTNTEAGTYTIQVSDHASMINMTNTTAVTITAPASLPDGWYCDIVWNGGASGTVAIAPNAGVTINSKNNYRKIQMRYGVARLRSIGGNVYILSGDLTR